MQTPPKKFANFERRVITSSAFRRLSEAMGEDFFEASLLQERIRKMLSRCFLREITKPNAKSSDAWEVVAARLAALEHLVEKIVVCKDRERFEPLVIETLEIANRLAHAESALTEVFAEDEDEE